MKQKLWIALLLFVLSTNVLACVKGDPEPPSTTEEPMPPLPPDSDNNDNNNGNSADSMPRVCITIGDQAMTLMLNNNTTARDFVSRLPLTVNMSDFAGTEKIFTPSPGLTTRDAPHGCHPKAGDVASYSPWRNIAIYYRDGPSYSSDMIPIGRIEGDISVLKTSGSLSVRFEIIKDNTRKK